MIEDKSGAELLGLQPPAAFRPPGCRSRFPLHLHSALPAVPTRSSPPSLPPRPGAPWGLWADPSRGADRAGVPPLPPAPAAVQGGAPSTPGRACAGPSPLPTLLHLSLTSQWPSRGAQFQPQAGASPISPLQPEEAPEEKEHRDPPTRRPQRCC